MALQDLNMMPLSRLDCPLSLKTPNMGNIGMTELFKLYLVSYCLGMLSRYFPSVWMALLRNERGDFAQPLLVRAVEAIESDFPENVLYQMTGYPKKLT